MAVPRLEARRRLAHRDDEAVRRRRIRGQAFELRAALPARHELDRVQVSVMRMRADMLERLVERRRPRPRRSEVRALVQRARPVVQPHHALEELAEALGPAPRDAPPLPERRTAKRRFVVAEVDRRARAHAGDDDGAHRRQEAHHRLLSEMGSLLIIELWRFLRFLPTYKFKNLSTSRAGGPAGRSPEQSL